MSDDKPITHRPGPLASETDASLGQFLAEARKRRGVTPEDVTRDAKIPLHYVRMIESDDYNAISDQLYVVPFLRRYATFLGLDAEDVASRFVRDVQKAENAPVRMPDPIPMVEHNGEGRWGYAAAGAVVAIASVVVVVFALWKLGVMRRILPGAAPSIAAPESSPAAAPSVGSVAADTAAPASDTAAPASEPSASDSDDLRPSGNQ